MYYKFITAIFLTLFMLISNFGVATPKSVDTVHEAIIKLIHKNDSLRQSLSQLTKAQKEFEKKIILEESEQKSLSNSYAKFIKSNNHSSRLSKTGAIILLIGSLFEIIGAILLAGADLSNKMEPIKSIHLEYTAGDLAIHDDLKDNVMTFLGAFGSLSILTGFCLQFTGTIIVLGLAWYWLLIIVGIAILFGVTVVVFLAKQTLNQTLREKIKIFFHNIHTVFIYPIKKKLTNKRTVVCEVCQKFMPYCNAEIWYKQGNNTDEFPYLWPPFGFYMGHNECLKTVYPDKKDSINWANSIMKDVVYKEKAMSFFNDSLNALDSWNQRRIKDLKHKRNSDEQITDETTVTLKHLREFLITKK